MNIEMNDISLILYLTFAFFAISSKASKITPNIIWQINFHSNHVEPHIERKGSSLAKNMIFGVFQQEEEWLNFHIVWKIEQIFCLNRDIIWARNRLRDFFRISRELSRGVLRPKIERLRVFSLPDPLSRF